MTGTTDETENQIEKKAEEDGGIIDAAARTRPRIHAAETSKAEEVKKLAFLADVPLKLNIVLGEATMPLGEVMALETDSIVQLDKLSGEPIDVYVENQRLGKGEVIVLHEKLRVRLVEITSPSREQEEPETQGTKGKLEG